ncbi:MAG: hypothetical protein ABSA44_09675 [Bacteroidota bacterium]|jgi:hypothetical protein
MSRAAYIIANATMLLSIALTPWLEDLLKLYLISAVVLITLTINVAFRIKWLMDIIVEHLVQAVLNKVLQDQDIQKIMHWKFEAMKRKSKK